MTPVEEALAYAEGIEMVLHGTFSDATEDHLVVLAAEVRRQAELLVLANETITVLANQARDDARTAEVINRWREARDGR